MGSKKVEVTGKPEKVMKGHKKKLRGRQEGQRRGAKNTGN
jgi:hypothetical protein